MTEEELTLLAESLYDSMRKQTASTKEELKEKQIDLIVRAFQTLINK